MTNTISPRIDRVRIEWEDDDASDNIDAMSCQAVATVSYPLGTDGTRRLCTFGSGGLYGIDAESDNAYRTEVEQEQLSDLREHLAVFGITCTDAEWAALTA